MGPYHSHKLVGLVPAPDFRTPRFLLESGYFSLVLVIAHDATAVPDDIQDEVAPHYAKTNNADFTLRAQN